MKRIAQYTLAATGQAVAAAALAHPGDHAAQTAAAGLAHVLTDPWHVGLALAVATGAAALLWRRAARSRSSRK